MFLQKNQHLIVLHNVISFLRLLYSERMVKSGISLSGYCFCNNCNLNINSSFFGLLHFPSCSIPLFSISFNEGGGFIFFILVLIRVFPKLSFIIYNTLFFFDQCVSFYFHSLQPLSKLVYI